jgi:type I restriction enzyme S subunit
VGTPEQLGIVAIACILGALDDKIELNRRMNRASEEIARAIFKSWFVDFDPVRAKAAGQPPHGLAPEIAVLFPNSFEDSELGEIPKGWQVKRFPDAIDVNPARSLPRGTVAPYLEMGNMPTSSARAISWEHRAFGSGMRFINGDTLVARITPCLENGKTAHVDFLANGKVGWGSTEYIVLRSKPPLPTAYSYFLARTNDLRSHVIKNMTGTSGRQRAPAECLDAYNVVLPIEPVARRFGEMVSPMLAAMKTNDEASASLSGTGLGPVPRLQAGSPSSVLA